MTDSITDKKDKKPEYQISEAPVSFTDVISVNVRNDYVHLGIGLQDINDPTQVEITQRVYMTLDHFLRFSDMCNKISSEIKKQIEKQADENKEKKD